MAATGDGKTQLIVIVLYTQIHTDSRRLSRFFWSLLKPSKSTKPCCMAVLGICDASGTRATEAGTVFEATPDHEERVEDTVVSRDQM